ncbi:hypothetical protein L911_2355 [Vibrio fluvialis I21563]|nr:hypothetical protein L911_2355 [Vibrio fluvialis I21563]
MQWRCFHFHLYLTMKNTVMTRYQTKIVKLHSSMQRKLIA